MARSEQKPSAAYSGWIWHWKTRLLLTGHQKLSKKLPKLQINGFDQSFLLFLTITMSLSNCNEIGYKRKKNFPFLSPRVYGSQTLLSHELTKNYDRNYSLYEGEGNLTPFFARSLKRTWPKKRTMQPSQLFPDTSQNQLYRRQRITQELSTVTAVPGPRQLLQHQL